jgi:hypothetical protein
MLTFVDDPAYRREMKAMRNLNEGRHHDLARHIFHGRKGELHQAYRTGQEDQLGALGLLLNCVTLWNTVYLDRALAELRKQGYPVLDEDVARLSAYLRKHINVYLDSYDLGYMRLRADLLVEARRPEHAGDQAPGRLVRHGLATIAEVPVHAVDPGAEGLEVALQRRVLPICGLGCGLLAESFNEGSEIGAAAYPACVVHRAHVVKPRLRPPGRQRRARRRWGRPVLRVR